ncbi:MAG: Cna B domain protein [Candidatus Ozemobacter sibiricus]|jgi:predicted small secreted protein|uniref:Cna B domain protein n=1 Tax=Candidatus Ozemobacter sibiricus TaxID=2268124 RepID=A0A367ZQG0_9BACT|nr:MAG: Cna B domain protein [Candidatus Ozemobacter sibiricus]
MLKRMLMATGLVLMAAALLIGCNTGSRSGADGSFPGLPTAALPTSIGTITGLVTDANALPINGANITLYSNSNLVSSSNTGSDGRFIISAAPGNYELRISKSGFVNLIQAVTIEAGRTTAVVAPLTPSSPTPQAKIRGIITNQTDQVQEGALIRLVPQSQTGTSVETTSSQDGTYSVTVAPGTYSMTVTKSGYGSDQRIISLAANEERFLDIRLGARVTLTGTVKLDTSKEALANITVEAYRDNFLVQSTVTTPEGVFLFTDLSAGMYTIGLARDSTKYEPATFVIQILRSGITSPADPVLYLSAAKTSGKVQGVISDLTGRPQEGALVRLISSNSGNSSEFTTLSDGRFSFSSAAGVYQLHVSKANFVSEIATISLIAGQELIKDIAIGPKSTLRGVVKLNTTKEPLPNILVEIFRQSEFKGSMETTSAGEFAFQDLTPDSYQVRVGNQSTAYSPATYTVQILNDGTISPSSPEFFISPRLVAPTDVRHPLATGTIYDAYTKAPLENVNCTLKGVKAVTTDMYGRFSFADLLPGNYELTFSKLGWQTLTVTFSITESDGATVLRPSPLTYELIQSKESGVGAIAGRYIDENTLNGVNDLIVRVYTYRLIEKTISVMVNGTPTDKSVSNWELDGRALPIYLLSTKTGVAGTGNESALGTFRLEHLQPTTSTMKYLVWIGTAASPSPTMTSAAYTEAADQSNPKVVWYQENVADPNRVHSWSLVDVYPDTTTFLQNFNLPN